MRKKLSSWPPVYLDDTLKVNGNNNPFRIVMNPNAPAWRAVYAQERREWPLRYLEVLVQLTIIGFFFITRIREWIEELGHAAEIAVRVQDGETYEQAEADEAHAMKYYKGLWTTLSEEQIAQRLSKRRDSARRWVDRHEDHLDRVFERFLDNAHSTI